MRTLSLKAALLSLTALLLTLSCSPMLMLDLNQKGEMDIRLDAETMRSALPGLDSELSYYIIEATHTEGDFLELVSLSTSVHLTELRPGEWTLRVLACNSNDEVLAEGTGTLLVEPGGNSSLTIVLYDVTGSGTLGLSLVWNDDLMAEPRLLLDMTTLDGVPVPVSYNVETGMATGETTGLSAGFYKLAVTLLDGESVVAGTVEIVLIRNETVTSVDLDLSLINKKGTEIKLAATDFTISWDSDDLSVDLYRIYYREHGSFNWVLLGSTDSGADLEYSIGNSMLAYGVYDFAVSSVSGAEESELHSSMDDTAVPATGWYINWESP